MIIVVLEGPPSGGTRCSCSVCEVQWRLPDAGELNRLPALPVVPVGARKADAGRYEDSKLQSRTRNRVPPGKGLHNNIIMNKECPQ